MDKANIVPDVATDNDGNSNMSNIIEDISHTYLDKASSMAITEDYIAAKMDTCYGLQSGQYELHPWRPHGFANWNIDLSQTVSKRGFQVYGSAGTEVVTYELKQVNTCGVLLPVQSCTLTAQMHKRFLFLMFLKQKGTGQILGIFRLLHIKTSNLQRTSFMQAVAINYCAIDAKEGGDVAMVDVPGAFMQADMDKSVHMHLHGEMAEKLLSLTIPICRRHPICFLSKHFMLRYPMRCPPLPTLPHAVPDRTWICG